MKMIIALCLALTACGQVAGDGYQFEKAEFDNRPQVTVTVVEHPSVAALRAEAVRLKIPVTPGEQLQAFGMLSPTKPTCEIHIVAPKVSYKPEWIGHEFTHCIKGRWHPSRQAI